MIKEIDKRIIETCGDIFPWAARVTMFVIYFWFGLLKIVYASPANPLVEALLKSTMPFLTFQSFIFYFGLLEMLIGICFLIPYLNRAANLLFLAHMATTLMPLIMLPQITWQAPFVPTLEGQYIIKNLALMATAIGLTSRMRPMTGK